MILAGWAANWHWIRNRVFRSLHLLAILFVVFEVWLEVLCPLTTIENHFRQLAGIDGYNQSFIAYWLDRLIFYSAPEWVFMLVYTLFSLLVIVTFITCPPDWKTGSKDHKVIL